MAARRQQIIPDPNSPGALTVTDGSITVGVIVEARGVFHAFDVSGKHIGNFSDRLAAMRALPGREGDHHG